MVAVGMRHPDQTHLSLVFHPFWSLGAEWTRIPVFSSSSEEDTPVLAGTALHTEIMTQAKEISNRAQLASAPQRKRVIASIRQIGQSVKNPVIMKRRGRKRTTRSKNPSEPKKRKQKQRKQDADPTISHSTPLTHQDTVIKIPMKKQPKMIV